MSLRANSRNLLTQVVAVVDPVLGTLVRPEFLDLRPRVDLVSEDDRIITVSASMTWANLAAHELGNANYWWTIADISGVVDPFEEFEVGDRLAVPSVETVLFRILASENT